MLRALNRENIHKRVKEGNYLTEKTVTASVEKFSTFTLFSVHMFIKYK